MHLSLALAPLALVVVASTCVQAASLRFLRSQDLTIKRLCESAQRQTVDAREIVTVAPSETIFPRETVLGRCDANSDCCDGGSVRRVASSESVALVFVVSNAVDRGVERYVNVTVQDHVTCECVDVEQVVLLTEASVDAVVGNAV